MFFRKCRKGSSKLARGDGIEDYDIVEESFDAVEAFGYFII